VVGLGSAHEQGIGEVELHVPGGQFEPDGLREGRAVTRDLAAVEKRVLTGSAVTGLKVELRFRRVLRELQVQPADFKVAPRLGEVRAFRDGTLNRRGNVDALNR